MSTQRTVADRVDASVDAVQPFSCNPALDRPGSETEREQLAAGDHAVLALGEAGQGAVDCPRALGPWGGNRLTLHLTVNVCHPWKVGASRALGARQKVRICEREARRL